MEDTYRNSMLKTFKKTLDDGFFPFIILDTINDRVKHFDQFWSAAKTKGFEVSVLSASPADSGPVRPPLSSFLPSHVKVYIAEITADTQTCAKRNVHGRSLKDISKVRSMSPACVWGGKKEGNVHKVHDVHTDVQQLGAGSSSHGAFGRPVPPAGRCHRGGEVLRTVSTGFIASSPLTLVILREMRGGTGQVCRRRFRCRPGLTRLCHQVEMEDFNPDDEAKDAKREEEEEGDLVGHVSSHWPSLW